MRAQEEPDFQVNHSECVFFGAKHDRFARTGLNEKKLTRPADRYRLGELTGMVADARPARQARVETDAVAQPDPASTIDKYIFAAFKDAGVTPAEGATDLEFLRRVSLDLTGRIPTAERVARFAADTAPDKRAQLVEELLAKPEWVDKWTMFFGDLFQNASRTTQINRYAEGRDAFNKWIHDSLAASKPYDRMASELIAAKGADTFTHGELNWVVGGRVTGGPVQDTWDQQAANVAETFLGLGNVNCLLCHNGRGHLDTLNLWAAQTPRVAMWQLSAFFTQGYLSQSRTADNSNGYWSWQEDRRAPGSYALGSTTGNRPPRILSGARAMMPSYVFSGRSPAPSDDYQAFLAKEVTSDIQFARAAVNYIWQQFFTRAIVEPANQFDPARLDPDNPPPAPWTLQPSNARLLNALAQDFVRNKFDLKALMRDIVNSRTYQISSRYDPAKWDVSWEPLYARKLVRRLWAEEVHDAVAQSSGIGASYRVATLGTLNWAMQFPEPRAIPGGAVGYFLDSFQRGNRDDQERRGDGSILQALSLMNDSFVMSRIRPTGAAANTGLVAANINLTDAQLIDNFYLSVLSRYPATAEKDTAMQQLQSGNRRQQAEDLLWSLYNKVDFVYNY
jgi:hypothetical protein